MYRSWIRIGLMIWARIDGLTLHWQIGNGLADWQGICRGLVQDWHEIGRLVIAWDIGDGLADWSHVGIVSVDWRWIGRLVQVWRCIGGF